MELLARRDIKRLMQLCGDTEADVRAAIGLIGRLEPKPGRRFRRCRAQHRHPRRHRDPPERWRATPLLGAAQCRRDAAPARA
jgi:hypothetical protein